MTGHRGSVCVGRGIGHGGGVWIEGIGHGNSVWELDLGHRGSVCEEG